MRDDMKRYAIPTWLMPLAMMLWPVAVVELYLTAWFMGEAPSWEWWFWPTLLVLVLMTMLTTFAALAATVFGIMGECDG